MVIRVSCLERSVDKQVKKVSRKVTWPWSELGWEYTGSSPLETQDCRAGATRLENILEKALWHH